MTERLRSWRDSVNPTASQPGQSKASRTPGAVSEPTIGGVTWRSVVVERVRLTAAAEAERRRIEAAGREVFPDWSSGRQDPLDL